MTNRFRRPVAVHRRILDGWAEGLPVIASTPDTIMASIQPASLADHSRIQYSRAGQFPITLLRMHTDSTLIIRGKGGQPGDLVEYEGEQWLIIAEAVRSVLHSTRVSHNRYVLVSLREVQALDVGTGENGVQ